MSEESLSLDFVFIPPLFRRYHTMGPRALQLANARRMAVASGVPRGAAELSNSIALLNGLSADFRSPCSKVMRPADRLKVQDPDYYQKCGMTELRKFYLVRGMPPINRSVRVLRCELERYDVANCDGPPVTFEESNCQTAVLVERGWELAGRDSLLGSCKCMGLKGYSKLSVVELRRIVSEAVRAEKLAKHRIDTSACLSLDVLVPVVKFV